MYHFVMLETRLLVVLYCMLRSTVMFIHSMKELFNQSIASFLRLYCEHLLCIQNAFTCFPLSAALSRIITHYGAFISSSHLCTLLLWPSSTHFIQCAVSPHHSAITFLASVQVRAISFCSRSHLAVFSIYRSVEF